eukprot:Lithocolla_globosa_v1_NODE_346_length_4383_cov_46.262055.p5 type:complete len:148 gc:universal NODE_346_length_4383_cov_46.262055:3251-2808(-)
MLFHSMQHSNVILVVLNFFVCVYYREVLESRQVEDLHGFDFQFDPQAGLFRGANHDRSRINNFYKKVNFGLELHSVQVAGQNRMMRTNRHFGIFANSQHHTITSLFVGGRQSAHFAVTIWQGSVCEEVIIPNQLIHSFAKLAEISQQ